MKWTEETYTGKKLYIGKYCVACVWPVKDWGGSGLAASLNPSTLP